MRNSLKTLATSSDVKPVSGGGIWMVLVSGAHSVSFPAPMHEGSAPIWHLADVLTWLHVKGSYSLTEKRAGVDRRSHRSA